MQSVAYPLAYKFDLVNTRINILQWILTKLGTYLVLRRVWNPIDFQGQGHWVKCLPRNILVNTFLTPGA
jgi:hypothetical protein